MIVIGYQGIGKTTLSSKDLKFIDLESSMFKVNGVRQADWYKVYGNFALNLSKQGYVVFTASHAPAREWIATNNDTNETVVVCYPSLELKDQWIEKLQKRYSETGLQKDFAALMNAKDRYADNIEEIVQDADRFGFGKCIITSMDYDLETELGDWLGNNDPVVYDDFEEEEPALAETAAENENTEVQGK